MKKMVFLIAIAAYAGFSCKKEKSFAMDTIVQLYIVNQQSENLLTTNPAILNYDNIEVYHVANGEKKLVNNALMLFAKGFLIQPLDGSADIGLKITPYVGPMENNHIEYGTTLIKLGDLGVDTIRCKIFHSGGSMRVSKVWYNSELKWDGEYYNPSALPSSYRRITVIKK